MSRRGFFTVTWEHLHLPGLNTAQTILLARMSSFGVFYESPTNTASFLNYAKKTLQTARQQLVKAGYIFELEDNGRGKKYIARADLRQHRLNAKDLKMIEQIKKRAQEKGKELIIPAQFLDADYARERYPIYGEDPVEEVVEETPTNPLRPSKGESKPRMSALDKEVRSNDRWRKKYPDLVPIEERAKKYLEDRGIAVLNPAKFRRDLALTAKPWRNDKFPNQHTKVLNGYLDFLDSDDYWYQVQHNKYAPKVVTADDLWNKFPRVRAFANDKSQWYDPSKVLTR